MRRCLLAAGAGAVVVALLWAWFARTDDLKKYGALREPRIVLRPNQKMLVVEVAGDPNSATREAMAVLFQNFYALKRTTRRLRMNTVRARWPRPPEAAKEPWVGIYGLPIPEGVEALPCKVRALSPVRIEVWEYGQVAEILHVGPYSETSQTAHRLRNYLQSQGYSVAGPQEEEYLRGPGLLFKGNPREYLTIIRYRVEKDDPPRLQAL